MKVFKFAWVDMNRCKMQLAMVFGIMLVFSIFMSSSEETLGFTCGYIFFLSVMFAGIPFNIENQNESGFIDMLPGTRRQRITGRFIYAISGILCSALAVCFVVFLYKVRGVKLSDHVWTILLMLLGSALILLSIQLILLFAFGKGKSQQFMTIIQVIPPLVTFFSVYGIAKYCETHTVPQIEWLVQHQMALAWVVTAIGIAGIGIAYIVANALVKKRDFA